VHERVVQARCVLLFPDAPDAVGSCQLFAQ
jgi:hypothetical protein